MYENYIDIGTLFVGIGLMTILFVFAYWMMQLAKYTKSNADKEIKYALFEELTLEKVAEKNGFNLQKELLKRESTKKKSFRKKIEEEVYENLFGKEEEDGNTNEETKS